MNLQSLQHYLDKATFDNKQRYDNLCSAMLTQQQPTMALKTKKMHQLKNPPPEAPVAVPKHGQAIITLPNNREIQAEIVPIQPNVNPNKAVIPFEPNLHNAVPGNMVQNNHNQLPTCSVGQVFITAK